VLLRVKLFNLSDLRWQGVPLFVIGVGEEVKQLGGAKNLCPENQNREA